MLTVSAVLVFFLGGYARYSGYSTPRRSGSEVETRRTTERGGWGNGERREHSGRDGGVRGERDSDRDMQDMRKCENAKKWRGHGLGKVPEETFSHLRIFAYKNVVVYFQKTALGCRKWHWMQKMACACFKKWHWMQKMACACFILGCLGVKNRGIARRKFGGFQGR